MSGDQARVAVAIVAADAAGLAALAPACEILDAFAVGWRSTVLTASKAEGFEATGLRAVIVASADGDLPGALAAATGLPVIRVPAGAEAQAPLDLLLDPATANLPAPGAGGAAFATVALGEAGAKNAALLVVSMLGLTDARLWDAWLAYRARQTEAVLAAPPFGQP